MIPSRVFATFLLIALLPQTAHSTNPWSYEGNASPEHWGELSREFQTCATGKNQSPVNITQVTHGQLPALGMNFQLNTETIINNGHTIQINLEEGDNFILDEDQFNLTQFHFHSPSENQIAGKSFPLEAHFVHTDGHGGIAVVAVMFEEGDASPVLDQLIAVIPEQLNQAKVIEQPIDVSSLFPDSKNYYRFSGSLTTPPCTEGVIWLILKQPVSLSASQLKLFQQALRHANNRPVQPLNGRLIVE